MTASDALPAALQALLVQVRAGLKKAGDDGVQGGRRALIPMKLGWAEVRAVYALHTALGAARDSRDEWKKRHARLEKDLARSRADIVDHDLLNNRAVVALFVDIERIMSGEEVADAAYRDTHTRVKKLLKRARTTDRRRATRV